MANRPVFVPNSQSGSFVEEIEVEFEWVPGLSLSQKKKNVVSLHNSASRKGLSPILEISTKSQTQLGVTLSAFNLMIRLPEIGSTSVECAFQGSKVFQNGGPFHEYFSMTPWDVRKDERLRRSGPLCGFDLNGDKWELNPKTSFYDWLYVTALTQNEVLSNQILRFKGFTDIEFNPMKSLNCQARSAALFVSLSLRGILEETMQSKKTFLSEMMGESNRKRSITKDIQPKLF